MTDSDPQAFRKRQETGVARLHQLAQRIMAAGGVNCALESPNGDVPKLYATTGNRSGPHEIVCFGGESLDLWKSPDGTSPKYVKPNISDEEAIRIVTSDYQKLKILNERKITQ